MGLSSKQVSSDGQGWNQALLQESTLELPKLPMKRSNSLQNQQQSEQLKCPRCDSTNTKFCYYNNYNKSQPRYLCKTCKRHWTKGGTLRNVPVGGGRKNKRLKPIMTATTTTMTTSKTTNPTTTTTNTHITSFPISSLGDEKIITEAFYHTLIRHPSTLPLDTPFTFNNLKNFNDGNELFRGLNQDPQCSYSNLTNFESNPCSISSSNPYNYTGEANSMEETVMNSLNSTMGSSIIGDQTWTLPTITSSAMEMNSNWGWDEIDKLANGDLTIQWDDAEIKP